MSLIGARPYTCPQCGAHIWVGGDSTVYCCPCCDSNDLHYNEEDTPIFALTVEDVRGIVTGYDEEGDIFAYQDFTIEECTQVGQNIDLGTDTLHIEADRIADNRAVV